MSFSFLCWNVRQYKGRADRLDDADRLISRFNPDVFGLIEFQAKTRIRTLMRDRFREYDFAVTDSRQGLELTIGWRRGKFRQVIWTQKRDFQVRNPGLRPGGLVSVLDGGEYYNLLFLHTDSGDDATAYRNRQTMFRKIWKLERALQRASSTNRANLIVLGDLNTMGRGSSISGAAEIRKLARDAERNRMFMLDKDATNTWHQWGRGPRSNRRRLRVSDIPGARRSDLDHVLASSNLDFVAQNTAGDAIHVEGWNQLQGTARVNFLWDLSDHSALYGETW